MKVSLHTRVSSQMPGKGRGHAVMCGGQQTTAGVDSWLLPFRGVQGLNSDCQACTASGQQLTTAPAL